MPKADIGATGWMTITPYKMRSQSVSERLSCAIARGIVRAGVGACSDCSQRMRADDEIKNARRARLGDYRIQPSHNGLTVERKYLRGAGGIAGERQRLPPERPS